QDLERQFLDRLPEMQESFMEKAQSRAEQTIAEVKLRYDERNKMLRELADRHEQEALDLCVELILDDATNS
ncbi:MAG: ATPase, partial [Gammaproteobacteria bacterium]